IGRGLDIEAVARADDGVVAHAEALAVPEMDAAADLARRPSRNALDRIALDDRVVRFAQVNAEQRLADSVVADDDARRGDVNARGVAAQIAGAASIDVEAFDRDVGGADANDAAVAAAAQDRTIDTD